MRALDPHIARQLAASLPQGEFVAILRTFEADLARLAEEYGRAEEAGDTEGSRHAAHSLAGAAAAIGATRLGDLARGVMEPGSTVPPGGIAGQIREETTATLAELAALAEAAVTSG